MAGSVESRAPAPRAREGGGHGTGTGARAPHAVSRFTPGNAQA